jgi:hypothetical protein
MRTLLEDEDLRGGYPRRRRQEPKVELTGRVCLYCGVHTTTGDPRDEAAEVAEHVVPRALGGVHTVPACRTCNASKGKHLLPTWVARIIKKAVVDRHLRTFELAVAERTFAGLLSTGWLEGYMSRDDVADELEKMSREIRDRARMLNAQARELDRDADALLEAADAIDRGEDAFDTSEWSEVGA